MTKKALLVLCACATCCAAIILFGWRSPKEKGRTEAKRDLEKGILCLKHYGYLGEQGLIYYELAKKKYGIERDCVAGCIVTDELVEYANSYNELMREAIKERFGQDALKKISDEAWGIYEKRQSE